MPPSTSWNSARIQNALSDAIRLREAGNVAFRAGNYKLSTEKYGEASYDTLYLKGLRHLQAIPSTDWTFVQKITEMQFLAHTNEAASWLKYEEYNGEVSRFQKALNCTNTAEEALKEHPTAWKPSDKAMGKLLYRRALALQGLEKYDQASLAVDEAQRLCAEDEDIRRLRTRIDNAR
ncbi:MAG: hypothetical protein HETSPECPRED_009163 [Heterodermia speciosa]|uniref:Uncharacterized protein n=1 Tax=Heterodermia speciosa TaxID=116794 RepID=A0A8H3G0C7_9LECA|nr:MAG: hypothetical protein HETSPECPRED_009163 [Heterodermia speciosa]